MSKAVVVSIPHALGRVEARRRIDAGTAQLMAQIGGVGSLTKAWEGDTLRFELVAIGQTVTGTIAVDDSEARLEVYLPGIFAMVAGKLKGRLRDEGLLLLGGPAQSSGSARPRQPFQG